MIRSDQDKSIVNHKYNAIRQKLLQFRGDNFEDLALEIYNFQASHNPVFKSYLSNLQQSNSTFTFLPISAFKHHKVHIFNDIDQFFESSGTTGSISSKHFVNDLDLYFSISQRIFENQFGKLENYTILALLPNYIERGNSSLVAMVDYFIKISGSTLGGFYINDFDKLKTQIEHLESENKSYILFGVSYALLDFCSYVEEISMPNAIVMETGGMKGKRKELLKDELQSVLASSFKGANISSEYGMTELFSQGYQDKKGWFLPGNTMKVITTEVNDPLTIQKFGKTGIINIIDLANLASCSFIKTEDIGIVNEDGSFKILGRIDNSDLRGCNLMVE
jgi:hypothetical protein